MPFVLFVKKAAEAMGRPGGDFTLKMAKKGERRTVQCGISTACFYPQDTMEALSKTQQLAPPCMEIFLNTFRELEPDYVQHLAAQLRSRNTNLISVHPFSSSMETFFFFSEYTPRFEDGLRLYRRYFEVCRMLGAHILVLHGNVKNRPLPPQEHARRFCRLAAEGEKFGVTVAYENVVRCQCGDPQQVLALRQCADRPVRFVLDLKQARRAGVTAVEMMRAMGPENICHLHLSDADVQYTCLPPGEGHEDLAGLLRELRQGGFAGDGVIELYRDSYREAGQLTRAMALVQHLADEIWQGVPGDSH